MRKLIKSSFLVLAVLLTAVMLLWPSGREKRRFTAPVMDEQTASALQDVSATDVGQSRMTAPRFSGQDAKGRTWQISADSAFQQLDRTSPTASAEMTLEKVTAQAHTAQGDVVSFEADQGFYAQASSTVALRDNVVLNGYGLTLHAPEILLHLTEEGVQASGTDVVVTHAMGSLKAPHFEADSTGETVRFTGGVTGHLMRGRR